MTPPLVTCICPTANRRQFLPRAIDLFLAQDYPSKQLVIVEDGPQRNADLVPPDPAIEYHYIDRQDQATIGEKRNFACAWDRTRGDLIAHWDDDDWHAPNRLSVQIAALRARRARLCGMDRLVFFDGAQAWLYQSPPDFLAGGSLIYERSLWREQPFEHRSSGEDTLFVRKAMARDVRIAQVSNEKLYVARVHAGNTDKKQPDHQWGKFDAARVKQWVGPEWAQ